MKTYKSSKKGFDEKEIEGIKERIKNWEGCTLLQKLAKVHERPADYEYKMLYDWINERAYY